jgi:hypothetical protein
MNQHKKFAAIALTSDGRQALRYIEPSGRDVIIHNVIELDGMTVDAKLEGFAALSDEKLEDLRVVMIDEFCTADADRMHATIRQQLGMDGEAA